MNHLVIVKAYQDEPVQLTAVETVDESVIVVGKDANKPLGFPRDLVFQFEGDLFAKLRAAFSAGRKDALARLWTQARPLIE